MFQKDFQRIENTKLCLEVNNYLIWSSSSFAEKNSYIMFGIILNKLFVFFFVIIILILGIIYIGYAKNHTA